MNEDETIKYLENVIKTIQESDMLFDEPANIRCGLKMSGAIQGLLDLYQKEKEKNKKSNKENTIINRRLENIENNYTQLIEDVSTLAIALELQEDTTIDEMYEEIKNLQGECKETDLEAQKYFEKYEDEKEKNKELESLLRLNKRKKKNNTTEYLKLNKLNKFGHNGICQDMRALKRKGITKYRAYITFQGKQYTLGSHDTLESAIKARKEAEKTIKKLLEENNGKQM